MLTLRIILLFVYKNFVYIYVIPNIKNYNKEQSKYFFLNFSCIRDKDILRF